MGGDILMKKEEFTLIELLVVIAVIALLAALLMPTLGHAKGVAKAMQCMANQKQVALMEFNYVNNWNVHAPVHYRRPGFGMMYAYNITWRRSLAYDAGIIRTSPQGGSSWDNEEFIPGNPKYRPATAVFRCPDGIKTADKDWADDGSQLHFQKRGLIWSPDHEKNATNNLLRPQAVKNPSSTVLFFDNLYYQHMRDNYRVPGFLQYAPYQSEADIFFSRTDAWFSEKSTQSLLKEQGVKGRHASLVNFIYFDGHGQRLASQDAARIQKEDPLAFRTLTAY